MLGVVANKPRRVGFGVMQVPAIWFTAVAAVLALSACGAPSTIASTASSPSSAASGSPAAAATDACPTRLTPAQTEGPYFKPGSPPRTSLIESGMTGTRLLLSGRVLTLACAPVAGVRLDFWQADAGGTYDNSGYRLRGHQSTDAARNQQDSIFDPHLLVTMQNTATGKAATFDFVTSG